MPKRQQDKELSSSLACDGMCVKRKLQHNIRFFFLSLLSSCRYGNPVEQKGQEERRGDLLRTTTIRKFAFYRHSSSSSCMARLVGGRTDGVVRIELFCRLTYGNLANYARLSRASSTQSTTDVRITQSSTGFYPTTAAG